MPRMGASKYGVVIYQLALIRYPMLHVGKVLKVSAWLKANEPSMAKPALIGHYISTLKDVKNFAHAARAHWGVENSLHWVLDVTFREDDSRIRTGYALENFNIFRQLGINLLKKEPSKMSFFSRKY